MNFSKKFMSNNVMELNGINKKTTLNPHAAEFVPSILRSSPGSPSIGDLPARSDASGTSGKAVLGRSESTVSNNSDEETHQYWCRQLPDDITPDFKFIEDNESQVPEDLPFANLSINGGSENSRFLASRGSGSHMYSKPHELSSPSYMGEQPSAMFPNLPTNPWDKRVENGDQHVSNGRDVLSYNGNSGTEFLNEMFVDDSQVNPVDFLSSQFPGFAAESLADVYYSNDCDLNSTIEMLIQLEHQVDSGYGQNLNSKNLSTPNLSSLDFPTLPGSDSQNGLSKFGEDELQHSTTPYRASNKDSILSFNSNSYVPSKGAIDFASAVRKFASQDSGQWKYERNGSSTNPNVGSSRPSHVLANSFVGGNGRPSFGDRLQNTGSARGAPVWLETGEAVGNMYSELREEARDHARLRNAYFDQARQAFLIGNKGLAKELSLKGQLHNMHMKAAHGKAQDSIYRQRNPNPQGYGRGQERMIDLHGLHVSEAIHRLRNELNVLRSAARSSDQRLQLYICVGTGHHTKGSRTPARLPVAVEQYLLQEGLEYTEAQPGLLRVVIY
ncbi:hypothetical protein GIB67_008891 [Kingdonia uniflora]|uniref:Smr domain-containing protein n=1 Tax=Kingdonia uniflora TaxID=39325 RepID=A0A7J7LVG2_9MAGN|nr:hypothetical protein GIB67_008891 [Kingdonia uniflora]